MSRPPPHVHGKKGVDGSSPSEGFTERPANGLSVASMAYVHRSSVPQPVPGICQVLFERVRFIEHAAPPVQTTVELDVAIDDLRIRARVDHHIGPAAEHLLAVSAQPTDQPVELFAAVSAGEHFVDRRGETWRIEHDLGPGCERPIIEVPVRNETSELEQTGPHQSSRADQVEQRILREHRPALSLSTLEDFVEHRRGHRDDYQARDEGREKRVAQPERVVGEVPHDRPGKDDHTQAADDPCRAQVRPRRVGAARTDSATSHLPPSILRQWAACEPVALSALASWSATRTATGSATSAAPRESVIELAEKIGKWVESI